MSPVALIMDALLAVLLTAALGLGVRLNARLKALRDGQAGFAAAVAELNQAAGRAEAGLASLKIASEEAHDQLLKRIETARELTRRLEAASTRAAAPPQTPSPTPTLGPAWVRPPPERPTAAAPEPAPEPAPAVRPNAPAWARRLQAARAEPPRRDAPAASIDLAPAGPSEPRAPDPRRRAALDDDLFDTAEAASSTLRHPIGL